RLHIALCFCATLVIASTIAEARGRGRFVGGLVTRGSISAASHPTRYKSYTPDVLTVDQLVVCLKKANGLDQESEQLDRQREKLTSIVSEVERLGSETERQRVSLNRYSQADVDRFNREVDHYNAIATNAKSFQSALNVLVSSHNMNVDDYNLECAKK